MKYIILIKNKSKLKYLKEKSKTRHEVIKTIHGFMVTGEFEYRDIRDLRAMPFSEDKYRELAKDEPL